jgi:HPt (histidine-containing phosphotransfer) domain-containing protein
MHLEKAADQTGVEGLRDGAPQKDTNGVASPLDLTHLRRYTLGDAKLEAEVLALFLSQLPVTITALSAASSDRDWRVAAHTIKGSGRAVGAWRLAHAAEEAERMTVVADASLRGAQVARIEEAAAEVRRYIEHPGQKL